MGELDDGPVRLLTVGHGTLSAEDLLEILRSARVERLVDVRRFPGSRKHPHMRREELETWLPRGGVGYRWEQRLGGRRPAPKDSLDTWWRVAAFRGYAAHMRTPEFADAVTRLAEDLTRTTVVMCSETLWWRCHRRMIADYAVLARGWQVRHVGHDGSLTEHRPAEGARVVGPGLVYDGAG